MGIQASNHFFDGFVSDFVIWNEFRYDQAEVLQDVIDPPPQIDLVAVFKSVS